MVQIFLAHANEDTTEVIKLYTRLQTRGYKPWRAAQDLIAGQQRNLEISEAIRKSDVFIACLSKQSVQQQGYIQCEFRMALQKCGELPKGKIFLIPVRLDDCQIPELRQEEYGIKFSDYHWIDLFEQDGFDRLVKSIDHHFPVAREDELSETPTQEQVIEGKSVDRDIFPYKGLEFFDCNEEDPKYFFGREKLIGELLEQVRTSNFMVLVGASGSGKSSVLRAGLLHQLKLGERITESDQWKILIMRPDIHPMKNLASAFVWHRKGDIDRAEALEQAVEHLKKGAAGLQQLVQLSKAPRTILVIDQFEEVFTRCSSTEEREQFFSCLMEALEKTGNKLCLIIAMRAEFVGKCLEQAYSGLAEQMQQHLISVLPLTENELRDAIKKPAEQANLTVEPKLVNQILNDIKGAPGSLPLLQYTLKELWKLRQENMLTLSEYKALGGINGTLNKRATEIYNSFDDDQQRTVQHIFWQLTTQYRRVSLDNLIFEPLHPAERIRAVIDTLSSKDNRLLVTSEVISDKRVVEVAHEALTWHWVLLRQWIGKNRDLLRQQRRIEASAMNWQERNQSEGDLLQGFLLKEALQFQKHHADTFSLSPFAKTFIKKSIKQRRWNLFKKASWLFIPAIIVVAGLVVEFRIRETAIKEKFNRLEIGSRPEESQAVRDLVSGCYEQNRFSVIPEYFLELVFGHCRSLYQATLSEAILSTIDFSYANLSAVNFRNADLSHANLSYTDLSYADLHDTDLSHANLSYTDLSHANLSDTDLSQAIISSANLYASNLSSANLSDTNFSYTFFRDTDLSYVDLNSAILNSADLGNADLSSADLSYTDLNATNLISANLSNTDLSDANLSAIIFLATDLRTTKNLTQEQLEGENPPFICNSPLPENIQIEGGKDRDCDKLANILYQRYLSWFESLEAAEKYIKEKQQKIWE